MATPLTICLVVLGRHVDQLEFLDVILGEQAVPHAGSKLLSAAFGSRPRGGGGASRKFHEGSAVGAYYDEVALKGLELAQNDLSRGLLDGAKVQEIFASVEALVDDLSDHRDAATIEDMLSDAGNAILRPAMMTHRPRPEFPRGPPGATRKGGSVRGWSECSR